MGSVSAPVFTQKLPAAQNAKASPSPRFSAKLKASFARFRPVENENAYLDQDLLSDRRTIDEVFDQDMSRRMADRYRGTVAPLEKEVLNPSYRASRWEMERYEQSRKDLANWTVKEVGKDQLKDFLRRHKDSSAISTVASTTGHSFEKDAKPMSEEERSARAHRRDLPVVAEEEPSIPTRLKAKLNVLKARGQLTFTNPVVTTMVEGGAGSGDNLAVEMNRDFRSLEMNSKVRYGVDESVLLFMVNKKITEEVSVDLNSQRWTGAKRSGAGEKKRETAQVMYSVSF